MGGLSGSKPTYAQLIEHPEAICLRALGCTVRAADPIAGTFSRPISPENAVRAFNTFIRHLRRALGEVLLSYVAVLEHRYSGCGNYAVPYHWHFLLATLPRHRVALLKEARSIWSSRYGNEHIDAYDPEQSGAYYIAKQAGSQEFEFLFHIWPGLPTPALATCTRNR